MSHLQEALGAALELFIKLLCVEAKDLIFKVLLEVNRIFEGNLRLTAAAIVELVDDFQHESVDAPRHGRDAVDDWSDSLL